MSEIDDRYYLTFSDPAYKKPVLGLHATPSVQFQSLEEFKSYVENANFSEEELEEIYLFGPDEKGKIEIINIAALYDYSCPDGMELDYINWSYGTSYSFMLIGSDTDPENSSLSGRFSVVPEDYFEKWCSENFQSTGQKPNLISAEKIDDRNATIYTLPYRNTDPVYWDGTQRLVQYTIELENKTLYVQEAYLQQSAVDTNDFTDFPQSIRIYGEDNGQYFDIGLTGFQSRPSVERLSEFGVNEYVETDAA